MKEILNKCELYNKYWENQEDPGLFSEVSFNMFKNEIKKKLKRWYVRSWQDPKKS